MLERKLDVAVAVGSEEVFLHIPALRRELFPKTPEPSLSSHRAYYSLITVQVISSAAPTAPHLPVTLSLQKLDVITLPMIVLIHLHCCEYVHHVSLSGKWRCLAPIRKYSNG